MKRTVAIADSRVVFYLCLLIFPITVIAYVPSKGDDYDIWFHLAYGKEFVQNLTWAIDHSKFSWTPAYDNWMYITWIGSGLYFLAYDAGGIFSVYALYYLLMISSFACLILYARSSGFRMDNISFLTALLLSFVAFKTVAALVKPENFTILFFFASTAIYFHGKQTEKKDLFWIYPILFLVWANTHGGVILGMTFLGLVIVLETMALLFLPGQAMALHRYKRLTLFALLALTATLINPHGVFFHLDVLGGWFADVRGIKEHTATVMAYRSMWDFIIPSFQNLWIYFIASAWVMLLLGTSLVFLLVIYVVRKKALPLAVIVLNLFFFLFSMSMGRALFFYPPVWFCSMVFLTRQMGEFRFSSKTTPVALFLFFILNIYIIGTLFIIEPQQSWFGSNLKDYVPVKEVDFIRENNLPGPILNDYLIGGYMIWSMYPDYKVFIDPRFAPYDKSLLDDYHGNLHHYMSTKGGLELFRKKYEFNLALIHMNRPDIINWLVNSPEWSMIYFDKVAAVLIHRSFMHLLSKETRALDVGPQRFRDLTDPKILLNLFNFYKNFSDSLAADIKATYERNVSRFFIQKDIDLNYMNRILTVQQKIKVHESEGIKTED